MVQAAVAFVDKIVDKTQRLELIATLRTVTDGKIYVEVEVTQQKINNTKRARVTRMLAQIREQEGNTLEACDVLQELQVETFTSMDRREKTDFILEQMRLCLLKGDYVRVQIISKKISTKYFEAVETHDLKLRYYALLVKHAMHEDDYLGVCKYSQHIYDTPCVKEDSIKREDVTTFIVMNYEKGITTSHCVYLFITV